MSSEEPKKEEVIPPQPTDIQPAVDKIVDQIAKSNEAADRLEKANAEMLANLERQERLVVAQTLGGKSDAGQTPQTEEQKEKEQVDKLLAGTGMSID